MRALRSVIAAAAAGLLSSAAAARPIVAPFDFSPEEIAVHATIKGEPALVLIDTGTDPSAIDQGRAGALGLKIERGAGGAISGVGKGQDGQAVPATIDGLGVGGRIYPPFEALATDLAPLSAQYGRRLDAILGYSFLKRRILLVDYPDRRVVLADRSAELAGAVGGCRRTWRTPTRLLGDEGWPMLPAVHLGAATIPATLDTGSSGSITLFASALDIPALRSALVPVGETTHSGFAGSAKLTRARIDAPVGFGPFRLSPGSIVSVDEQEQGSAATRLANIGNHLFAALRLKLLFDYRHRSLTFYGDCR